MNLETEIDRELWNAVRRSYESGAWSNAILDAIYRLSDIIRLKTGLQSDGTALAGQAFGGKSPKLRLNRLETESEISVQAGVEQLVRGLYQTFRNPRSHGKEDDSQHDADAVIVFVNHLIKLIGVAKSEFSLETCVDRIIEENFVPSQRYAELVISEIPVRRRLDVTLSVYQRKEVADGKKLRHFFDAVIPKLSASERADLFAAISNELRQVTADSEIRTLLQLLNPEYWGDLDEASRLRIEHRLIKDMQDGRYDRVNNRCTAGSLATWSRQFFSFFALKDEAYQKLVTKLWSSSREQQDYVFEHFFSSLGSLKEIPDTSFESAVSYGLKAGDARFYSAIMYSRPWKGVPWSDRLTEAIKNYEESHPEDDEDVPF